MKLRMMPKIILKLVHKLILYQHSSRCWSTSRASQTWRIDSEDNSSSLVIVSSWANGRCSVLAASKHPNHSCSMRAFSVSLVVPVWWLKANIPIKPALRQVVFVVLFVILVGCHGLNQEAIMMLTGQKDHVSYAFKPQCHQRARKADNITVRTSDTISIAKASAPRRLAVCCW